MANKPVTTTFSEGERITASKLNTLADQLATAVENGLGRGGTGESPNSMQGDLDMNLNQIRNVGAPTADNDAVRLIDIADASAESSATAQLRYELANPDNLSLGANLVARVSQTVETIEELRSKVGEYEGSAVSVLGYYTPGDGGGGPLRIWKGGAAPGTYVDNGGSIIVPIGGDGSGAWVWDYSGAINVRWFGAVGDGVTDDTVAIQAAIDVCQETQQWLTGNNEEFKFTDGRTHSDGRNYIFLITKGIKIRDIKFSNIGYSLASSIFYKPYSPAYTSGYYFENVIIESMHTSPLYVHTGITLQGNINNVYLTNCSIKTRGESLLIRGAENYFAPGYENYCENINILNNYLYSHEQNGIFLIVNQKNINIHGNTIESWGLNSAKKVGIFLDNIETAGYNVAGGDLWSNPIDENGDIASIPLQNIHITDNNILNYFIGVVAYSAIDCVIRGNNIKARSGGSGITVQNTVSDVVVGHEYWPYIVESNNITARTGITCCNSNGSVIKGNIIKGSTVAGNINLQGIRIVDYSSTNPGAECKACIISDNRIDSPSDFLYTYGIRFENTIYCRDHNVSGNLLTGSYVVSPFAFVNMNTVAHFFGNASLDHAGGNVFARIRYTGTVWEVQSSSKNIGISASQLTWNDSFNTLDIDLTESTGVMVIPTNTSYQIVVNFVESTPNVCRVEFRDAAGVFITSPDTNMQFIIRVGT